MAARLARWLGSVTSPDTLRRQRAEPLSHPSPRGLGVDAFVRRRGYPSGPWRVDFERRQPVAVLEGRTAAPRLQWRQAYPGGRSRTLWGWIAARCAWIWRRTNHRATPGAVPGHPHSPRLWASWANAGPRVVVMPNLQGLERVGAVLWPTARASPNARESPKLHPPTLSVIKRYDRRIPIGMAAALNRPRLTET
jgi:hypothetical protein